jgi:hypothetical protein
MDVGGSTTGARLDTYAQSSVDCQTNSGEIGKIGVRYRKPHRRKANWLNR